jgi:hypothetical protein
LTRCAAFDVFCDPCSGARPEIFLIDASDCFISPGVTIDSAFMPHVHEFAFQPLIQGYDELLAIGISPEWFIWVIYMLDWVDTCPFFH